MQRTWWRKFVPVHLDISLAAAAIRLFLLHGHSLHVTNVTVGLPGVEQQHVTFDWFGLVDGRAGGTMQLPVAGETVGACKTMLGRGSVEGGSIVSLGSVEGGGIVIIGCFGGTVDTGGIHAMVERRPKCVPERVGKAQVLLPFLVNQQLLKFGISLEAGNVTLNLAKMPYN